MRRFGNLLLTPELESPKIDKKLPTTPDNAKNIVRMFRIIFKVFTEHSL